MNKRVSVWISWVVILGTLLLGVSIFSLCVGPAGIPAGKIISLLLNSRGSSKYSILMDIRLPRIILGLAIGGALSLAGVILQGMFRNPLVEPYTLGISGGAALGVCLNIVFGLQSSWGSFSLPLFGFAGAVLIILLIYFLSMRKGILKMQGLLLTGVMLSFICSALVMLIMAVARSEDLQGIIYWIMGSLEQPDWRLVKLMLFLSVLSLGGAYLFCLDLNALSLGEEKARHLGVNVERSKRWLFVLASLLTGCSVALAGIIGFVGLVVPHLLRMFVGRDHRILLITSFLCGGSLLILCDTLARTIIAPLELPVGVITGVLGGSIFIYALSKKQALL